LAPPTFGTLMQVALISIGRFHHFHLARQLERHGCLHSVITGYPRFKLRDETGIPAGKIKTYPWLQGPYMAHWRFPIGSNRLEREWAWWAHRTLDWYAAQNLDGADVLVALSNSGARCGAAMRDSNRVFVCDRGSSHIEFQDRILREEYRSWGFDFKGIDPRVIANEQREYELASLITVPSEFARQSFLTMGTSESKVAKIRYGARLDRFRPHGTPDRDKFSVLFVGEISLRKGFPYLLEAFQMLKHPRKELIVIGAMSREIASLLKGRDTTGMQVIGSVPNADLPHYYSKANVTVLPSVEEGFGMVLGEAMACGCPVIASENTGAADLFTNGVEGYIVPIRDSGAIAEKLTRLAGDPQLRDRLSERDRQLVKESGGWDTYGDQMVALLRGLLSKDCPDQRHRSPS
jgi:glycosyltransferase involved in cell wall biosynthesis